ncbi:alpha/beta hydrolase [Alkalibaculum sporogenes]|nr:alpha/beta hydrolase [Alkalibaculum sporogenes]
MVNFEKDLKEYEKLFPNQMKIIDGVKFEYRFAGNGEKTIVLLVGGLGMSDALYNHAREFAKDFRVLLFDYPLNFKNNEVLADGIASLIRELDLGKVALIGQSYGGFIAQVIASRHKEIVGEMVLSNTGCMTEEIDENDMKSIYAMLNKIKKVKWITRIIPVALLRKKFIKRSMQYLKECTNEERQYMHDLFKLMFGRLTNKGERHMCELMLDLINIRNSSKDFSYLDGKVLLILSKDDETFSEAIKQGLVNLMPNPKVCYDLSGGHLTMFLKIDTYISMVKRFINDHNK